MKWINDKGTKIWGKTTDALTVAKNRFAEERIGVTEKIRIWIVILFVKAIDSCSSEQDKLEVIAWLALVRKILEDSSLSFQYKV